MIEQIVLDVLKGKSNEAMWGYQVADKGLYITENKFEDIAKSISNKISAVSIDRDKLIKVLDYIFINFIGCVKYKQFYEFPKRNIRIDINNCIADKIISLLKPVNKTLNRGEIIKILERKLHEHYGCMEMVEFKSWENGIDTDDINEVADQICNLAIPEPKLISRSNISKPFDYKIKEGDK